MKLELLDRLWCSIFPNQSHRPGSWQESRLGRGYREAVAYQKFVRRRRGAASLLALYWACAVGVERGAEEPSRATVAAYHRATGGLWRGDQEDDEGGHGGGSTRPALSAWAGERGRPILIRSEAAADWGRRRRGRDGDVAAGGGDEDIATTRTQSRTKKPYPFRPLHHASFPNQEELSRPALHPLQSSSSLVGAAPRRQPAVHGNLHSTACPLRRHPPPWCIMQCL
jgi:hypothetical protein